MSRFHNLCKCFPRATACALIAFLPPSLRAHGSLHEQLQRADRRVEASPGDADALVERAELHRQHGEMQAALADLDRAAAIKLPGTRHLFVKALIHVDRREYAAAKLVLDRLLNADPRSADALLLRSKANEELGQPAAAISDARAVLLIPSQAALPHHLHLIELLKRHGSRDEVAAAYQAARISCGQVPSLMLGQARWLGDIGRHEQAAAVLGELRASVPALLYDSWAEETRLWSGNNSDKARHARREAERAWVNLPERLRKLPAMRTQHDALMALPL